MKAALSTKPVLFHKFVVTPQVFYQTPLSFAFTNIKPVLPGHILICPHLVVSRMSELTSAEVADLFLTAHSVGQVPKRVYHATGLNIIMQDGWDAGQSVPHVHIHLIPRKSGDTQHEGGIDAVYKIVEGQERDVGQHLSERDRPRLPKADDELLAPRTEVEMAEEEMLRREIESCTLDSE